MEYGLHEAILLHNFTFWIAKNKANEHNFYEGRTWTFNTNKAYAELFPFFSERQIRTALNSLVNQGVLVKGCFNKDPRDRTLWYAFYDEAKFLYIKPKIANDIPVNCNLHKSQMQPTPESVATDFEVSSYKEQIKNNRYKTTDVSITPVVPNAESEISTDSQTLLSETALAVSTPLTPKAASKKSDGKSSATWEAYSQAFENRYEVKPVRNAKVSKQLCNLVDTVGAEVAPLLAAFYVNHNKAFYVNQRHSVDFLLKDAHALYVDWHRGEQMTGSKARQVEKSQGNFEAARQAARELGFLEG